MRGHRLAGPAVSQHPEMAAFGTNPLKIDGYAGVGVRAGMGAQDDRRRVEVRDNNVLNKCYWSNVYRSPDAVARITGMPATYGVTLRTKW